MKKVTIGLIAAAVIGVIALAALGTASFVSAQTSTPQAPNSPSGGRGAGYGMMGRGGGMTQAPAPRAGVNGYAAGDADGNCDGALHDAMVASLAEKLGLTLDALNARLANGETMAQIAFSQGLSQADFFAWMQQARSAAIAQGVANGSLTQAQADWMSQRGAGMMNGAGRGMMGTARSGAGYGMMGAGGRGMTLAPAPRAGVGGYANQNAQQGQFTCPYLQP